jgi:diguanylate cyclase (GGDEF)-like protein
MAAVAVVHRRLRRHVRWPSDTVGRLRLTLAVWAASTSATTMAAGISSRHLGAPITLACVATGLLLAARYVRGYRRRTYTGPGELLEIGALLGLALIVGDQLLLGMLFPGSMLRASFDRPRRAAMACLGYAVVFAAGALVDVRGDHGTLPTLLGQLVGLVFQTSLTIVLVRTLTQRDELTRRLAHLAGHDTLTGLPNRATITAAAEAIVGRQGRKPDGVAALFVDLDGFKDVNDTLGHPAGDRLLVAAAKRMSAALRTHDVLGRLGGDEFVVLVEDRAGPRGPEEIARRLVQALRQPFHVDGHILSLTASVGVAVGTRPSGADLLRDADIALYRAKASGKDRWVVFEPDMQHEFQRRLAERTAAA